MLGENPNRVDRWSMGIAKPDPRLALSLAICTESDGKCASTRYRYFGRDVIAVETCSLA